MDLKEKPENNQGKNEENFNANEERQSSLDKQVAKNFHVDKKENFVQNFDKVPKIMTENNVKKRVEIFNKNFGEKQKIKSPKNLNYSGNNLSENKNVGVKSVPCNSKTFVNQEKPENNGPELSSTKEKVISDLII